MARCGYRSVVAATAAAAAAGVTNSSSGLAEMRRVVEDAVGRQSVWADV